MRERRGREEEREGEREGGEREREGERGEGRGKGEQTHNVSHTPGLNKT